MISRAAMAPRNEAAVRTHTSADGALMVPRKFDRAPMLSVAVCVVLSVTLPESRGSGPPNETTRTSVSAPMLKRVTTLSVIGPLATSRMSVALRLTSSSVKV